MSPAGDSWGIFTFLCAALCNLPALPALNCSEELGAGQSIQKTYDLTRYLEHQLRTLAGTYVSTGGDPHSPCPPPMAITPGSGVSRGEGHPGTWHKMDMAVGRGAATPLSRVGTQ